MKNHPIQVLMTTAKKEDAERIAENLVKQRMAGCVQILGPISSVYWWKDKIETSQEYLCLIKTEKHLYRKLEQSIKNMHSYEMPEITAFSIHAGSKQYLRWLHNNLKQ